MSEWIKCSDRMPNYEFVIGYALSEYPSNWYVGMLRYNTDIVGCPFYDDSSNTQPIKVSHWMPFPEPPEDLE